MQHSPGPAAHRTHSSPITRRAAHIFGDMKIEIIDPDGKVVDTIAGSKHRGINRATWSMRLETAHRSTCGQRGIRRRHGPRVLPGTYTVKMTKGDKVYTSKLKLVLDPRAPYNEQDRREQFDLAMKLYKMMGRMSFAVDSMVNLRDAANCARS